MVPLITKKTFVFGGILMLLLATQTRTTRTNRDHNTVSDHALRSQRFRECHRSAGHLDCLVRKNETAMNAKNEKKREVSEPLC